MVRCMFRYKSMIRDPIYGFIDLTETERQLLETVPMQRLRLMKQCPSAEFVYPGATHSRFAHSLGVMHIATKFASNLDLKDEKIQLVRLAGLLHDVGHGPFGHAFEDAIGWNYLEKAEEIFRKSDIKFVLDDYDIDPKVLADLINGRTRERYLGELLNGPVDADKLDYLLRDSYFTGISYGSVDVDRILTNVKVFEGRLTTTPRALESVESFFFARYQMYNAVYYHRTVRAVEVMLRKSFKYASEIFQPITRDVGEFLKLNDASAIAKILEAKEPLTREMMYAKELAEKVVTRRLYKVALEQRIPRTLPPSLVRDFEEQLLERTQMSSHELAVDYVDYEHLLDLPFTLEEHFSEIVENFLSALHIFRVYCRSDKRDKVREIADRMSRKYIK